MKISIIIPCYNNEKSLNELMHVMELVECHEVFVNHLFEYIFVDDGSKDNTFLKQTELKAELQKDIKIVKLTRNFGSYNSLLAGMYYATGDCNVYLHADLQDPPELIPELFQQYLIGNKLVIANRSEREDGSVFSALYHWMVRRYAVRNIPTGGFDLILFDRKIKDDIVRISEKSTNNVYLISWLGYPYVSIPYSRQSRKHGVSQWTLTKKVRLFFDTFFSFSDIPITLIRLIFLLSLVFCTAVLLFLLLGMVKQYSLLLGIAAFLFFMISLSFLIIGEFLIRIHETVRNRPNFVVDEVI